MSILPLQNGGDESPMRLLCALILLCLAALPLRAAPGVLRDVHYGPAPLQTMDVYLPPKVKHAPIILMVHGGAWVAGDKSNPQVVDNKVGRWVKRGFIFISVNYPMVPDSDPVRQADNIARALAAAQDAAPGWGGDPARFILMGHSSGAHLVSLLNADPQRAFALGAHPWLGTVSLDSGALDVPDVMQHAHMALFDRAFGDDPAFWHAASPIHHLSKASPPWLGVCNSNRALSCDPNKDYAAKAKAIGLSAEVYGVPLRHGEINRELGLDSDYTRAVEAFMAKLDPGIAALLQE
jgi:arylformamidase